MPSLHTSVRGTLASLLCDALTEGLEYMGRRAGQGLFDDRGQLQRAQQDLSGFGLEFFQTGLRYM
jgi:hypothetical protein